MVSGSPITGSPARLQGEGSPWRRLSGNAGEHGPVRPSGLFLEQTTTTTTTTTTIRGTPAGGLSGRCCSSSKNTLPGEINDAHDFINKRRCSGFRNSLHRPNIKCKCSNFCPTMATMGKPWATMGKIAHGSASPGPTMGKIAHGQM